MSNLNQPPNPPYQLPPTSTEQPPQPPSKPKRPKRFGWLAASLFALGGLALGGLASGGDSTTTTAEPGPTTTVTATETAAAKPSSEPSKAPEPKKTTPPKAPTTMGEGTFEIGVDAPAGRYKTVGEDNCYWERTKDDSGSFGSILANNNVNDGARASVTVKRGEFFTSSGCGTWTKV